MSPLLERKPDGLVTRTSALGSMQHTATIGAVSIISLHLPMTASHSTNVNSDVLESLRRTTTGLTIRPVHLSEASSNSTQITQDALSELRRLSGLTWEQLAGLFGVSRRTLHFWASGQALSRVHEEKLNRLLGTIRYLDRGSASLNRNLLLSPSEDSQLPIDLLSAGQYEEVKQRLGAGEAMPRPRVRTLSDAEIASRLPPPPSDLVDALQDSVHRDVGRSKPVRVVRNRKHDAVE